MFVYIPGEAIAFFTFPGVMVHEISHRFFCDIFNIPVYEVNYFDLGNKKAGHVIHGQPNNAYQALLISTGPLIINTIVCMLMTFPMSTIYFLESSSLPHTMIIYGFMAWIGHSAGLNAFPSNQDIYHLLDFPGSHASKALLSVIAVLIWMCNLKYINFFIAIFYTYAVSTILPRIFFG